MTKVFLDLDGVLVNFVGGLFDAFHLPEQAPAEYEFFGSEIFPPVFWEVNERCTREFWENLEWTEDGRQILALVEGFFPAEDVYLLSTPMPNRESWTGKYEWVLKNMPTYRERLIIMRNCKSVLAAPNHLLVDDKEQNIEQFVEAGGRGILVPRSWNFLRDVNTLDFVRGELFDVHPHPMGREN
jgi:hypothetical protein